MPPRSAKARLQGALETQPQGLDGPAAIAVAWKLQGAPSSIADRLIRTAVGNDARFARGADGRWRFTPSDDPDHLTRAAFTVVDLETTGIKPPEHRITELAAVHVRGGELAERFVTLVNPERVIPLEIVTFNGITDAMVAEAPPSSEIFPAFLEFLGDTALVAHNLPFDQRFLRHEVAQATGDRPTNPRLCTVRLARKLFPDLRSRELDRLCRHLGIRIHRRHRAEGDAEATAQLLLVEIEMLLAPGIATLDEAQAFIRPQRPSPKRGRLARRVVLDPPEVDQEPSVRSVRR